MLLTKSNRKSLKCDCVIAPSREKKKSLLSSAKKPGGHQSKYAVKTVKQRRKGGSNSEERRTQRGNEGIVFREEDKKTKLSDKHISRKGGRNKKETKISHVSWGGAKKATATYTKKNQYQLYERRGGHNSVRLVRRAKVYEGDEC